MRVSTFLHRGFTLVEVVLALGVATVALVSVIGVLGVAVKTSEEAGHDTRLAAMSTQVLSDLRASPFDALWEKVPRTGKSNAATSAGSTPPDSEYSFTGDGTLVEPAKVAGNFDVVYQCSVKKTPDPRTRSANGGAYNLVRLQLTFTWPVSAPKRTGGTTIHASIARY